MPFSGLLPSVRSACGPHRGGIPGCCVVSSVRELSYPRGAVTDTHRAIGQVKVGDTQRWDARDVPGVARPEREPGPVNELQFLRQRHHRQQFAGPLLR